MKIKSILDMEFPANVHNVRRLLGMIQYYRDLWEKRSHILAPLSNLVGECGTTKNRKKPKRKFKWEPVHQEAFERMKQVMSRAVTLAYPDFSKDFEVYTEFSDK